MSIKYPESRGFTRRTKFYENGERDPMLNLVWCPAAPVLYLGTALLAGSLNQVSLIHARRLID